MSEAGEWADLETPEHELSEDTRVTTDAESSLTPRQFAHLARFVEDWFCEIGWQDTDSSSNRTWCPEWWQHSAAIVRLEAIYRAFEYLRHDPALGISTWLKDHADYHMAELLDSNGPFKGCSIRNGHDPDRERTLSVVPAPNGLFDADD